MSESEKRKRLDYKRNRKKWITIQAIVLVLVALILLGSYVVYYRMSQAYYIEYTEDGYVDYQVHLKENDFYKDEWLDKDQSYVSSLVDSVLAEFRYTLDMNTDNVNYEYVYSLEAQLEILDNSSNVAIYDPIYVLKEEQRLSQSSNNQLEIREFVTVDYAQYNDLASEFKQTYGLVDTTSTLIVRMNISVIGNCGEFQENSQNDYVVALHIPLTSKTVNINMTSTVPVGENKVLACENGLNKNVFKIIAIVAAVLEVLLVALFIAFCLLTRNHDINYSIKVKKFVSRYRSYIQKITNVFDTTGYQVLLVETFTEMLGIRDTIQSPILMSENEDQTCTQFIIPTNTQILYLYQIKVENYDEIYGEPQAEEPIILEETVDSEELAEALESPDVDLAEVDFVDEIDPEYEGTEEKPAVEVVGVVWPERPHRNKIYRYDPNGETLNDGDVVLVPTKDASRNKEVIRKAAVAHGNHTVDPDTLRHPLKKIIAVVKHKAEKTFTSMLAGSENNS